MQSCPRGIESCPIIAIFEMFLFENILMKIRCLSVSLYVNYVKLIKKF